MSLLLLPCVLLTQSAAAFGHSHGGHEARQHVFEYLELFYNRTRKHAALGYLTPAAFENLYHHNTQIQAA